MHELVSRSRPYFCLNFYKLTSSFGRNRVWSKVLGYWLRRCRAAVGKVKGSTFIKLMEMLVESVLLYGAEVWGYRVWRAAQLKS